MEGHTTETDPADQSNTGRVAQDISNQAGPSSGQSMSGQNAGGQPSTLQKLASQKIVYKLMAEQEVASTLSPAHSPLDLSLIEEVMTGQKSPSLLDPSSRKRKLSTAAGSAEQEKQNEKEARTASNTHQCGSSKPQSEGNARMISNNESTPHSKGTNGAPQTDSATIASKREHLTLAITSQKQQHEVRKHEIGLRGVLIKDKVDMVVAQKREKSEYLANENIQILESKQQTFDKIGNVPTNNDVQYLPTLKQVSYKPETISKLDIVPLFGDVNDGTSPQDHSTYGIGKGFKSLDMPSQPDDQPTYGVGQEPKSLEMSNQSRSGSPCSIGERFDNTELTADNPSVLTPDHRPSCIRSNISASKEISSAVEMFTPHSDSSDLQHDRDFLGELPEETIDEFIRFFSSKTDELPASGQSNDQYSSVTVSSNAMNGTPSVINSNTQESSNVSVIASFRHSLNKSIARVSRHTTLKQCWLHGTKNKVIKCFDKEGNEKQTINIDCFALGIVMTGSDTLLICKRNKCISQIVLPDSTTSTVFCTPYIPIDICVSPTGEILVTMADAYNTRIMPQQCFVVKYTYAGQEVRRSQLFDKFGNSLFMCPKMISVNHEGDRVAVVNYTIIRPGERRSHLVMLNGNLELVARYIQLGMPLSRNNRLKTSGLFSITDVKFDKGSHVLVAEQYSRSIQLLDRDCQLLRVLMGWQTYTPVRLAVDVDGDVWINYKNGCVKIIRYQ